MKTSCPLTLIVLLSCVGYFSSSCSLTAALPLNTSMVVPASCYKHVDSFIKSLSNNLSVKDCSVKALPIFFDNMYKQCV